MSMIIIQHLRKEYAKAVPLVDVSAEIQKGDAVSVIGPPGSGKSTLLRCINRLEKPTSGKIWIEGTNIISKNVYMPAMRRKIGMVFRDCSLFGSLNVIENLMRAPVELLKKPRQEAYEQGIELLKKVGLSGMELAYSAELTRGQRQRAAIARALAMQPEIMLLDKPEGEPGSSAAVEVAAIIRRLSEDGLTMVIATNDMRLARNVSNRIFYLDQGVLYEQGTPEQIFKRPMKERTKAFISNHRTLHAGLSNEGFDFPSFMAQLEEFGRKWEIGQDQLSVMQHITWELLVQRLPAAGFCDIKLDVEYTKEDTVQMYFCYSGRKYHPFDEKADVPAMECKEMFKKIEYGFLDGINLLICKL